MGDNKRGFFGETVGTYEGRRLTAGASLASWDLLPSGDEDLPWDAVE